MGRDILISMTAIALIVFGGWLHHTIGTPRHEAHTQTAIDLAVSVALDDNKSLMNCNDFALLESIRGMAENGIHLKGYKLKIAIGNINEWEAWE